MPIDTEVDKEAVVHTCNGILLGQKKEKKKQYHLQRCGWTQRDGMGREEGGGFRMGNTCIPVADSF